MIAITGASGTVGSTLRRELKQHDVPFIGFYRSELDIKTARSKNELARLFDYDRPETFGNALQGIDTLFLLATGVLGQAQTEISIVNAAVHNGVSKIVKLSVIDADNSDLAFGRLHREVESHIQQCCVDHVFLRPNEFMQNFNVISLDSIASGFIHEATADASVSFVDVRDIAAVARIALTVDALDNQVLTLTGPEALTQTQVADCFTHVLGWQVEYVPIDDADARRAIISSGAPEYYADHLVNLARFFRNGGGTLVSKAVQEVTGQAARDLCNYISDHKSVFREARAALPSTDRASN